MAISLQPGKRRQKLSRKYASDVVSGCRFTIGNNCEVDHLSPAVGYRIELLDAEPRRTRGGAEQGIQLRRIDDGVRT